MTRKESRRQEHPAGETGRHHHWETNGQTNLQPPQRRAGAIDAEDDVSYHELNNSGGICEVPKNRPTYHQSHGASALGAPSTAPYSTPDPPPLKTGFAARTDPLPYNGRRHARTDPRGGGDIDLGDDIKPGYKVDGNKQATAGESESTIVWRGPADHFCPRCGHKLRDSADHHSINGSETDQPSTRIRSGQETQAQASTTASPLDDPPSPISAISRFLAEHGVNTSFIDPFLGRLDPYRLFSFFKTGVTANTNPPNRELVDSPKALRQGEGDQRAGISGHGAKSLHESAEPE